MIYAIGRRDELVRMYLETNDVARAEDQLQPGEVAFSVEKKERGVIRYRKRVYEVEPQPLVIPVDPRYRRDQELAATDWTQMADADLTPEKKLEWKAYRQALRDYPETEVWPDKP